MEQKNVKTVIAYYRCIPEMSQWLKRERDNLEDRYNCLHGINLDGLPHGSVPGRPTEKQAEFLDEQGVGDRLREINVKISVLEMDREAIRGCFDCLRGEYKRLLFWRYFCKYSWGRIAAEMGVPNSTARNRHDKALERFGNALEDVPMSDEILIRAGLARW